ncbi:MAG: HTH domain-containing protein [Oscillospiraceae bacterium]|nr:HTH domain-containing protein [Oscillospiraceae bacterium]
MKPAERRAEIMRILCRRRHEKASKLAEALGVSTRTIQRDIEMLSTTEPIYTLCGRYDGGVYVMDNFYMSRMYMTSQELAVLQKLLTFAEKQSVCNLTQEELATLSRIISLYTRPKTKKGNEK